MKSKILTILIITIYSRFFGQITTSVNPTIAQLQQKLSGNGVTISNVSITCPAGAYALFSGGTGALSSLTSGVLLTTGTANNINANNTSFNNRDNNGLGSLLGDNLDLSGEGTFDACYLKFLITPACNTLSINYIFASEEYPDNVGLGVSDVFGFVIDGPNPLGGNYNQTNIALIPGTNLPVSIDNVNFDPGFPPFIPPTCNNCAYYVDTPPGIVYDGATTVLSASAQVTPCQQYTMTIGVWDVGDGIFDSGVFLDVNGLSCVGSTTLITSVSPTSVCGPQTVTLTASGGASSASYTWSAPANGNLTSTTGITTTANPTTTTTYTLLYSDANTCPGLPLIETATITFTPLPSFPVLQSPATGICIGQSSTLTANGGAGSYSWTPNTALSSTSGSVVVANPTITTTYTVTKTIGTCSSFSVVTINVGAVGGVTVSPLTSTICAGNSATLIANSTASPTYTWIASNGVNPPNSASVTINPTISTTYTVVSGIGTCTNQAIANLVVVPALTPTITASSTSVCITKTVEIIISPNGTNYNYSWQPASEIEGGSNSYSIAAKPTTTSTTIYTVTLSDTYCSVTNTVMLQVFSCTPPAANFTTLTNDSICTNGCITFTTTSTGSEPMSYEWLFVGANSLTSTISNPQICYPIAGDYTVVLVANNPWGSDTIVKGNYINVEDIPSIIATGDTLIRIGQYTPISVTGANYYQWIPNDGTIACYTCSNTTVQPFTTTEYIVAGYNSPYCKVQDTVLVEVDIVCGDIFIPNVFSPNGDGLNDNINVHGYCVKTYKLQIFNRWGEKVFETKDKTNSWDGNFRGKPLDSGVFVYKVEGISVENKSFTMKGNITLLR